MFSVKLFDGSCIYVQATVGIIAIICVCKWIVPCFVLLVCWCWVMLRGYAQYHGKYWEYAHANTLFAKAAWAWTMCNSEMFEVLPLLKATTWIIFSNDSLAPFFCSWHMHMNLIISGSMLDVDTIYHFATVHHHNGFETKQSRWMKSRLSGLI